MSALLREALAELVRLHELDNWAGSEEAYSAENFTRWNEAGEEVRRGFPLAWEAARRALASPPPQAPSAATVTATIRLVRDPESGELVGASPAAASPEVESLPPLPKKRRKFFCTKCGSSTCVPSTENHEHPLCQRCNYLGFAGDCDYNDDEMLEFAHAAIAATGRPATEQNPVAFMRADGDVLSVSRLKTLADHNGIPGAKLAAAYSTPLYASSPSLTQAREGFAEQFKEWQKATGALPTQGSWYFELLSLFEEADAALASGQHEKER